MSVVVAIHQPNFLPWLGFFDKLARADCFVLLDDAQFPKKQGNWTNRVRVLIGGAAAFVTVPVVRAYHGVRTIGQMAIDDSNPWRAKTLRTIEQSYSRAPCFDQTWPVVRELIEAPVDNLADFNEVGIRRLAGGLGIDVSKLVRSSTLGVDSTGTERLVELTRAVGGTTYLSGDGASGYQDDERFGEAGLELRYQRFNPPPYPQRAKQPVPGLSAIDALMHCGWEITAGMVVR
jgi:hypothetical protein